MNIVEIVPQLCNSFYLTYFDIMVLETHSQVEQESYAWCGQAWVYLEVEDYITTCGYSRGRYKVFTTRKGTMVEWVSPKSVGPEYQWIRMWVPHDNQKDRLFEHLQKAFPGATITKNAINGYTIQQPKNIPLDIHLLLNATIKKANEYTCSPVETLATELRHYADGNATKEEVLNLIYSFIALLEY